MDGSSGKSSRDNALLHKSICGWLCVGECQSEHTSESHHTESCASYGLCDGLITTHTRDQKTDLKIPLLNASSYLAGTI